MAAFLLSIREGVEAVLVVSILLGTLRRLNHMELARHVWLGVASAGAISLVLAAILTAAGIEFEGRTEQLFEGSTLLIAAAFLTFMLFWMQRQGTQLRTRLSENVRSAALRAQRTGDAVAAEPRGGLGLFMVAFLAVLREGTELALLLAATAFSSTPAATAAGALLGLGTAVVLGALLFRGVLALNLKRFFAVTNLVLLVFAAGMLALGVHEFVEAGVIPAIVEPVWNTNTLLSDKTLVGELLKSLFGYNGNPALPEVIAYAGYLLVAGWALWVRRRPQATAMAAH